MIAWDVKALMAREGLENPSQLSTFAGLTYPVAQRVAAGEPLERIEVATLETLQTAFKLRMPWKLLKHSR